MSVWIQRRTSSKLVWTVSVWIQRRTSSKIVWTVSVWIQRRTTSVFGFWISKRVFKIVHTEMKNVFRRQLMPTPQDLFARVGNKNSHYRSRVNNFPPVRKTVGISLEVTIIVAIHAFIIAHVCKFPPIPHPYYHIWSLMQATLLCVYAERSSSD